MGDPKAARVIRAYFDGSGKSHDPHIDHVSFAGYVGTEKVWGEFETAWQGFKKKYGIGAPGPRGPIREYATPQVSEQLQLF